jgi:isoquinoline 1-oxidoreductase
MVDELAHAVGKDPEQYRIDMLDGKGTNAGGAQRLRNTLLAAMGMSGYGTRQLPRRERPPAGPRAWPTLRSRQTARSRSRN